MKLALAIGAVACLFVAGSAVEVEARYRCPAGQILRVSSGACVGKHTARARVTMPRRARYVAAYQRTRPTLRRSVRAVRAERLEAIQERRSLRKQARIERLKIARERAFDERVRRDNEADRLRIEAEQRGPTRVAERTEEPAHDRVARATATYGTVRVLPLAVRDSLERELQQWITRQIVNGRGF